MTERFKYSFNLWFYMKSRSKRLGLAGLALGGALSVLPGCFLNPNNYPGHEEEIQAYNRRRLVGGFLLGATPYARSVPQAAALNAAGHMVLSNNNASINANGLNNSYVEQSRNTPYLEQSIASHFERRKSDGSWDYDSRVVDQGRTIFSVGEKFLIYAKGENCEGKNVRAFSHWEGNELPEQVYNDSGERGLTFYTSYFNLLKKGKYKIYFTLDGVKVSNDIEIYIKED